MIAATPPARDDVERVRRFVFRWEICHFFFVFHIKENILRRARDSYIIILVKSITELHRRVHNYNNKS